MSDRQLLSATLQDHVRMGSVRSSRAEINNTAEDGSMIQKAHKADSSLARNTNDDPKDRALPPVPIPSAENSSANSSGSSPVMVHTSKVQVLQLAEPLEHVDTAKSADQTTPMSEGAKILCLPSTTPTSASFSSISSMGHSDDSNMSDTSERDSAASGSTPTPPDTANTSHRSNHESHPPTAASETRSTRPKSPPLLPPWTKLSNPLPTLETVPGMVNPAIVLQRLFNNPLYSDLALTVNDTTFHVHRGILAEQCSYFRRLFEDARSRNPTTEIKKIDCSYKHVSHEQVAKERDLIETHGEDEDEVETLAAPTHEPQDHRRAASLRMGKFQPTNNEADDDEKQFDADAEDAVQDHPSGTKAAKAACPASRVPKTTQSLPPKANGTPPDSFSSHHPQLLQEDLHLEPFPDLGSNTSRAILAVGYTPQHFALFLQILYGIQPASTLKDSDLLPVFRIAHVYELTWLISLLGAQIFQRLTLSAETWVPILHFAERYQLDTIRQRTIEYASQHRALWTLAVETLSLEDFKVFLRAIHQKDAAASGGGGGGGGGVKDELLMIFLLVHYQDTTSFSATVLASLNATESSSATANLQPRQQVALLRRLSRSHSRRQRAVNGSSVLKIRQQLHGAPVGSAPHAELSTSQESCRLGQAHNTHEGRQGDGVEQSSDDKAEKAKLWMRRFKIECGWDGRISALD
ncbi:hypothetical protein BG005_008837 [Podila minutissima]|nr:hypothetical protein BG005_008837 [Podila minutissima]